MISKGRLLPSSPHEKILSTTFRVMDSKYKKEGLGSV